MLGKVIRWTNGMVMSFNLYGEPVPHLQGRYEEVRQKILLEAGPMTVFQHGDWMEHSLEIVPREMW